MRLRVFRLDARRRELALDVADPRLDRGRELAFVYGCDFSGVLCHLFGEGLQLAPDLFVRGELALQLNAEGLLVNRQRAPPAVQAAERG